MEIVVFIVGIVLFIRQIVLADRIHRLQYRVKLLEEQKQNRQEDSPSPEKQTAPACTEKEQAVCAERGTQTPQAAPATEETPSPLWQNSREISLPRPEKAPEGEPAVSVSEVKKPAPSKPLIDWESFTAAKLFSWIGGFTLFLGIAFGIKYSIDNSLLSPAMRVAGGALCGAGLLAAGLLIRKDNLKTTSHTLCGCGLAVLYACIFGAYAFYHLIGQTAAFTLMAALAAASFASAVWKNAKYIAFLAEIISFLTPFLLSDGEVRPVFFFTYVAFVLAASAASALKRKWNGVLIAAAAFAAVSQSAYLWSLAGIRLDSFDAGLFAVLKTLFNGLKTFSLSQTLTFCFFSALYCAAAAFTAWKRKDILSNPAKAVLGGFAAFNLLFVLLAFIGPGSRLPASVVWMGLALWLNVLLAFLAYQDKALHAPAFHTGKILVFLSLLIWSNTSGKTEYALLTLCSFLAFAAVNAGADLLAYKKKARRPGPWAALFPVLLMTPLIFPMALNKATFVIGAIILTTLFAVSALFSALMKKTPLALAGCAVFMLALLVAEPGSSACTAETALPLLLALLPSLIIFTAVRRVLPQEANQAGTTVLISSLMPYILLLSAMAQTSGAEHMRLFLLFTLLISALNMFFAFVYRNGKPVLGALAGAALVQLIYATNVPATQAGTLTGWIGGLFFLFALCPFVFKERFFNDLFAWAASALSGIAACVCLHLVLQRHYTTAHPGLLPMGFAFLYGAGIYAVSYWQDIREGIQRARLAWLGGATLFFITFIFPLELGKSWLTVAWALEGAALVWLNRKLRHKGLTRTGFALLAVVFFRLLFFPGIADYDEITRPLFNGYLYTFGISATAMLLAAEWWRPEEERTWRGWLRGLGGVTLFALLNIEIASYFSFGGPLSFDMFGAFNSAIAYTAWWTAFGAVCLLLGMYDKKSLCARTGMALILLALLKLFLSDIWALSGLYRIGGLIGIAALLILISFIYQRAKQNR